MTWRWCLCPPPKPLLTLTFPRLQVLLPPAPPSPTPAAEPTGSGGGGARPTGLGAGAGSTAPTSPVNIVPSSRAGHDNFNHRRNKPSTTPTPPPPPPVPSSSDPESFELAELSPRISSGTVLKLHETETRHVDNRRQLSSDSASSSAPTPLAPPVNPAGEAPVAASSPPPELDRLSRQVWREYW